MPDRTYSIYAATFANILHICTHMYYGTMAASWRQLLRILPQPSDVGQMNDRQWNVRLVLCASRDEWRRRRESHFCAADDCSFIHYGYVSNDQLTLGAKYIFIYYAFRLIDSNHYSWVIAKATETIGMWRIQYLWSNFRVGLFWTIFRSRKACSTGNVYAFCALVWYICTDSVVRIAVRWHYPLHIISNLITAVRCGDNYINKLVSQDAAHNPMCCVIAVFRSYVHEVVLWRGILFGATIVSTISYCILSTFKVRN